MVSHTRVVVLCIGIFVVATLFGAMMIGRPTFALWSDQANGTALSIQAMHATATTQAQSNLFTPSSTSGATDPQQFTANWSTSSGSNAGTSGSYTYGPKTNCSLPTTSGSSASYPMCVTYSYNADSATTGLVSQIQANPPSDPANPPTYTVSSAVALNIEAWGSFAVNMGYSMAESPVANSMLGASVTTMSVTASAAACTSQPAATSSALSGAQQVIAAGYADKQNTVYLCFTQSFTPYDYQTTATATNGVYTHTDSWWGAFYEAATGSTATLTIGLSPQTS